MPLFDPTSACGPKGTQRMSRKKFVVSVFARPEMNNQTPRHSSTK